MSKKTLEDRRNELEELKVRGAGGLNEVYEEVVQQKPGRMSAAEKVQAILEVEYADELSDPVLDAEEAHELEVEMIDEAALVESNGMPKFYARPRGPLMIAAVLLLVSENGVEVNDLDQAYEKLEEVGQDDTENDADYVQRWQPRFEELYSELLASDGVELDRDGMWESIGAVARAEWEKRSAANDAIARVTAEANEVLSEKRERGPSRPSASLTITDEQLERMAAVPIKRILPYAFGSHPASRWQVLARIIVEDELGKEAADAATPEAVALYVEKYIWVQEMGFKYWASKANDDDQHGAWWREHQSRYVPVVRSRRHWKSASGGDQRVTYKQSEAAELADVPETPEGVRDAADKALADDEAAA